MSEIVTPTPAAPAKVEGTPNPAAPAAPAANDPAAPAAMTEVVKETPATPDAPAVTEEKKDEPAPERVIPENYELALPEGSLVDADRLDELKAEAKESKLTNEEAQKLLDREHSAVARHMQRETDGFKARSAEWKNQIKADPVIGGENAARVAEVSHRFIEQYAPQGLKDFIGQNNLGDYPDFVRMIHNAATDLGFDGTTMVNPGAHGVPAEETPAQILYGNKK